jgi:hypothetical protein
MDRLRTVVKAFHAKNARLPSRNMNSGFQHWESLAELCTTMIEEHSVPPVPREASVDELSVPRARRVRRSPRPRAQIRVPSPDITLANASHSEESAKPSLRRYHSFNDVQSLHSSYISSDNNDEVSVASNSDRRQFESSATTASRHSDTSIIESKRRSLSPYPEEADTAYATMVSRARMKLTLCVDNSFQRSVIPIKLAKRLGFRYGFDDKEDDMFEVPQAGNAMGSAGRVTLQLWPWEQKGREPLLVDVDMIDHCTLPYCTLTKEDWSRWKKFRAPGQSKG